MDQAAYSLDETRRNTVLAAIQEVCAHRGWRLLAAHVRTTHVHTVVEAEVPPETGYGRLQSLHESPFESEGVGQTWPKEVDTARQHAMALET